MPPIIKISSTQNYLKDETEALNVYAELIDLDRESGAALAARDRMDKIEGKPKPQPPTESGDQSLQFSAVNYPNPANPGTTIKYTLPDAGRVSIKIYNVMGHEVADLVDAGMPAGSHIIRWDGGDKSGNPVASGLYFYRIQYDKRMLAKKFLLLR